MRGLFGKGRGTDLKCLSFGHMADTDRKLGTEKTRGALVEVWQEVSSIGWELGISETALQASETGVGALRFVISLPL